MSQRPRLVATDLDGTLLDAEGRVSARTRGVLDELDARGVPVVFVTGRPIRWMASLWEAVGNHGLAICSNGGIVYDVARHQVTRARTINQATLLGVGATLREHLPGTSFALEKLEGFAREHEFFPRVARNRTADVPIGPLEQIVDGTVVKLLARHDDHPPEHYWAQVEALIGDQVTTTWSSVGTLVEMSGLGVTKASTLADLCADLGIGADEVIAFGDMPNDLPLLGWAGTAYAVANAHPSVLEAAHRLAPAHDEDGVARVLAEVFDLDGHP